jgi:hypothetical protein
VSFAINVQCHYADMVCQHIFGFFDAVIQVSFDQIVFDQKTLDHIANSVHKTFDLLTNWLRFVYFVKNAWSQFGNTVC